MFCSIIIPVYSPVIGRFERLLESMEEQSCKDFKVFFINDRGSEDFKSSICQILKSVEYEIVDLEVNVGQGLARQRGIELSNDFEWITFVDQDDTLTLNAVGDAKRIIEDSGCKFVLSTKSIVSNDYDWVDNKLYTVDESVSVLHGKFYNREMLLKYDIHFTDKVRAHEDTFFQNLIYGYHVLSPELNSSEVSIVVSNIITYNWYLWGDSTSHKTQFNSIFGRIGYLEATIREYVIATIESYKEVTSKFEPNSDFIYSKLGSFIYFLYWFESAFEYINPLGWKKENLLYIKYAIDFIMGEFNMVSINELTDFLKDTPGLYRFTYNEVLNNIQDPFVPLFTVEQYFRDLDARIDAFKLDRSKSLFIAEEEKLYELRRD